MFVPQDPGETDFKVEVFHRKKKLNIYVIRRPFLEEFLSAMAERYEIGIFTASLREYAEKVIQEIDPHKYIQWVLYRDSCSLFQGCTVKNLQSLPRALDRTVLVDDRASSFMLQSRNGILCTPFLGNREDTELQKLCEFLTELSQIKGDLREYTHNWIDSRET